MSCTPFQVDANSLATLPYGVVRRSARAITPLCHSRNQPEPYYLQQWALAGDGGVLRYVPVLNTLHLRREASKCVPSMSLQYLTRTRLRSNQPSSVSVTSPAFVSPFLFLTPSRVRRGQYGALAAVIVCVQRTSIQRTRVKKIAEVKRA